jgi:hypothetical protein
MDKIKPFELISTRFQISRESAKYFLVRVQRSFKTEKPPHQLIIDFMDQHSFETLPRPHQVATMMHDSGVWTQPLNPAPPIPMDEEDFYEE